MYSFGRMVELYALLALVCCCTPQPVAGEVAPAPEHQDPHSAPKYPGLGSLPTDEIGDFSLDHPFETGTHTKMIRDGALPSYCVDVLARAQWLQDIEFALWAPAHFDNCRFSEAQQYLASQLASAEHAALEHNRDSMLVALGRGLHGVQDFYAHTNYVELMAAKYDALDRVPIVEVWHKDGLSRLTQLVSAGLVSGCVWWEVGETCKQPALSHADLNKDSGQSKRGAQVIERWGVTRFRAARELAIKATHAYLQQFLSRPAWAALLSDCQGVLGYHVGTDHRAFMEQP